MVKFITMRHTCQQQIDACHVCLTSTSASCATAALTFNIPWNVFRVKRRDEALCAQGKTGRICLQIVRYSHELILWAQFLYFFTFRKVLKSLIVMTVTLTWRKFQEASRKFLEKYAYVMPCPYLFDVVSQSCVRCCLLGCSPYFVTNKT